MEAGWPSGVLLGTPYPAVTVNRCMQQPWPEQAVISNASDPSGRRVWVTPLGKPAKGASGSEEDWSGRKESTVITEAVRPNAATGGTVHSTRLPLPSFPPAIKARHPPDARRSTKPRSAQAACPHWEWESHPALLHGFSNRKLLLGQVPSAQLRLSWSFALACDFSHPTLPSSSPLTGSRSSPCLHQLLALHRHFPQRISCVSNPVSVTVFLEALKDAPTILGVP